MEIGTQLAPFAVWKRLSERGEDAAEGSETDYNRVDFLDPDSRPVRQSVHRGLKRGPDGG